MGRESTIHPWRDDYALPLAHGFADDADGQGVSDSVGNLVNGVKACRGYDDHVSGWINVFLVGILVKGPNGATGEIAHVVDIDEPRAHRGGYGADVPAISFGVADECVGLGGIANSADNDVENSSGAAHLATPVDSARAMSVCR